MRTFRKRKGQKIKNPLGKMKYEMHDKHFCYRKHLNMKSPTFWPST